MEDVVKLRTQLVAEWESEGVRPSYTDIIMLAAAKALLKHPRMHSTLADDAILRHEAVHMGMAVALEEGLVVPVIRNADSKDLKTIAGESRELAEHARGGKLGLDDMSGGTFTVTSLGMYGVDTFTPILNTPQSGILGVGRIYVCDPWHGETPVPRKRLRLSLTWDHRALDGAPAAEFLVEVRGYLEFVADQRLVNLGMEKHFGTRNPLAFMDLQDVQELSNFFERRVSSYQVAVTGQVAFDEEF